MEYKEIGKYITCIDCGVEFEFEVGEQEYFKDRGLSKPKRCPACRKARRLRIQGGQS